MGFFYFSISESYFKYFEYKKVNINVNINLNIRKFPLLKLKEFFRGFRFLQYKNSFFLRKYKKVLFCEV